MKVPRDLSGSHLADTLCRRWRYTIVHQVGSHIILETSEPFHQRISISGPRPASPRRRHLDSEVSRQEQVCLTGRDYRHFVACDALCSLALAMEARWALWIRD